MINLNLFLYFFLFNLIIFLNLKKINYFLKKKYKSKIKIKKKEPLALGGFILFLNFLIISIIEYNFSTIDFFDKNTKIIFFYSIISIFLLGLIDDLIDLNPWRRLILLCFIIYLSLNSTQFKINSIYIDILSHNIYLKYFSLSFTILAIITFINFNNMYDGINGQSSIYYSLILLFLISKNLFIGNLYLLLFFQIFFIIFNFYNKIYLGDSGVYLFSIIIAYLVIYGFTTKNILLSELVCLMIIPFIDMVKMIISRMLQLRHPFSKDKKHYHHIIVRKFGNTKGLFILHSHPIISIFLLYLEFQLFYVIVIINILIYFFLVKSNS